MLDESLITDHLDLEFEDESGGKPIVHFSDADWPTIQVGGSGRVVPIDHPNASLNGVLIHTSQILNVAFEGRRFETLNSIYLSRPHRG